MYIIQNHDARWVAGHLGCHVNTVYRAIKRHGLRKSRWNVDISKTLKYGVRQSGGYAYVSTKSSGSLRLSEKQMRYALLLDHDDNVESWDFRLIRIPYVDPRSKKFKMFYIDFSVQSKTGDLWVELKLHSRLRPSMKRLCAAYDAKRAGIKFRGLTPEEVARMKALSVDRYRSEHGAK